MAGAVVLCIVTSLPNKHAFLALRTPLVMAVRAYRLHSLFTTVLPVTGRSSAGLRNRFEPFTLRWLFWAVFLDSAWVIMFSNVYRHISSARILVTGILLAVPLRRALSLCQAAPPSGPAAAAWAEALDSAARRVRLLMHGALPVGLWDGIPGWLPPAPPDVQERTCLTLYMWSVTTFGYLVPWALAVCLEEAQRWKFFVQKGHYRLPTGLGPALAHSAVAVVVGAHVVWVALDTTVALL